MSPWYTEYSGSQRSCLPEPLDESSPIPQDEPCIGILPVRILSDDVIDPREFPKIHTCNIKKSVKCINDR